MFLIRILTLFVAIILTTLSWGQSGGVKGYLIDATDSSAVGYATVAVFNRADSSVINFALTDGQGGFEIGRLPAGKRLRLFVSHVLYSSYRQDFQLDSSEELDLDSVFISIKSNELEEAVVSWEKPPIMVKGDTVQFDADAFINRPGSVVEDLLKNIPGVDINENGEITFNGRKVSRITIDSKTFFGDDPTLLLKNIPAKAIEDVQVTEEKDQRGKLINQGNVTLNLTLKDWAKTGHFGKLYAGYGSDERYEAGGLWNFFRDTLQISVIGYGNNLSNQAFSYSDVYKLGGFNRAQARRTTWYSDGRIEYDGIGFGGGNGITESGGGGVNLNYDIPQKLKFNLAYFMGFSDMNYLQTEERTDILNAGDSTVTYQRNSERFTRTGKHTFRSVLDWTPDTVNMFSYNPVFSIGFNEQITDLNQQTTFNAANRSNAISNTNKHNNIDYEYYGDAFWDQDYNTWSWRVYNSLDIRDASGNGFNDIQQFNPDTTGLLNEYQIRNTAYKSFGSRSMLSFDYTPNDSFRLYFNFTWDVSETDQNTMVQLHDSNGIYRGVLLPELSTQFKENRNEYSTMASIQKKIAGKWSLNASVQPQWRVLQLSNALSNVWNRRDFFWIRPDIGVTRRVAGASRLSLDLSFDQDLPNSWDLLDMTDNRDPNFLRRGNPFLKAERQPRLTLRSFGQGKKTKISHYAFIRFVSTENEIIRDLSYDSLGRQVSTPVNLGANQRTYSVSGSMSFRKRFNKGSLSHRPRIGVYGSASKGYTSINNELIIRQSYYTSLSPSYTLVIEDKIDIRFAYNPNLSYTHLPERSRTIRQLNQSVSLEVWWAITEKNWIEAKWSFTKQQVLGSATIPQQFNLLNVSYTRRVLKNNQGELRLSVFDLLGQNTSIDRYVGTNYYGEKESNVVTRYIMLSFVYNLHQFKTTGRSKRGFEFW